MKSVFNCDISAFDEATLFQALMEQYQKSCIRT
jgi:hypothetical protein